MAGEVEKPKKTGGACTPTRFITLTPQAGDFLYNKIFAST